MAQPIPPNVQRQTGPRAGYALASEAMSGPKYFKTSGHLLLCQDKSCRMRGADLLYLALVQHLEREKLAYYKQGGTLRLTTSGCLGACQYGPTLCVYRQLAGQQGLEEAWYAAVDMPLARRVAQAVHDGEALPTQGRYGPGEEAPPSRR